MRIRVWHGVRRANDETAIEFVEFDGEEAGEIREETEKRRKQTTVYRASDGRIVIREIWTYPNGEEKARVWFFPSIDRARERFGWELETVGLHPSRRAIMEEFEEWD